LFTNVDLADDGTFFFERLPGREIRIMVEGGQEDFVARAKLAADRAREGECNRGHVLAEDDLIGVTMKEIGHGRARAGDHLVGSTAGQEGATRVGVGVHQVALDGVHHLRGNLRSRGSVEKRGGLAVDLRLQGRKLGANPGDIQSALRASIDSRCAHGSCFHEVIGD